MLPVFFVVVVEVDTVHQLFLRHYDSVEYRELRTGNFLEIHAKTSLFFEKYFWELRSWSMCGPVCPCTENWTPDWSWKISTLKFRNWSDKSVSSFNCRRFFQLLLMLKQQLTVRLLILFEYVNKVECEICKQEVCWLSNKRLRHAASTLNHRAVQCCYNYTIL